MAAVIGITITPTRRSVTAMLDNIMFEVFCRSRFCFIARIMNAFRRMVGIETVTVMMPKIKSRPEPHVSNDTPWGANGQESVELQELMLVSLLLIFMLNFYGKNVSRLNAHSGREITNTNHSHVVFTISSDACLQCMMSKCSINDLRFKQE